MQNKKLHQALKLRVILTVSAHDYPSSVLQNEVVRSAYCK